MKKRKRSSRRHEGGVMERGGERKEGEDGKEGRSSTVCIAASRLVMRVVGAAPLICPLYLALAPTPRPPSSPSAYLAISLISLCTRPPPW